MQIAKATQSMSHTGLSQAFCLKIRTFDLPKRGMARRGLPVFARPGPGLGPDLSGDFGVAFVGAGREKTVLVVLQLLTHSMVILARHPQCLRASRPHSITRCICNAPFFFFQEFSQTSKQRHDGSSFRDFALFKKP